MTKDEMLAKVVIALGYGENEEAIERYRIYVDGVIGNIVKAGVPEAEVLTDDNVCVIALAADEIMRTGTVGEFVTNKINQLKTCNNG